MNKIIFTLLLLFANISFANDDILYALEQRINELTDRVEKLTHQNSILQKKIDSLASDFEFRMKEIASKHKEIEKQEQKKIQAKSKDPKQVKLQFDQAYNFLKEQKYAEAEGAFSNFVESNPKTEYTGEAYYWLGETFMLRKRYDKAAINYIMSFDKFPKNNKADLSVLKLASALKILGKKQEACAQLTKLKTKNDKLSPSMKKLLSKEIASSGCKIK